MLNITLTTTYEYKILHFLANSQIYIKYVPYKALSIDFRVAKRNFPPQKSFNEMLKMCSGNAGWLV